jgi:hypothetical protein
MYALDDPFGNIIFQFVGVQQTGALHQQLKKLMPFIPSEEKQELIS